MLITFSRYQVTGENFTVDSTVLSMKAVMVTSMGLTGLHFSVWALKSLQNANRYCPKTDAEGSAGTVRLIVAVK